MLEQPLVSIIINCYNGEKYLADSLKSVIKQKHKNWELIFWDNLSIDSSAEIFNKYNDKRLKYVNTGKRVSMRANFEFALKASSGDYVIFFGDDDGIIPDQFKHLRYILEEHTPDSLSWDFLTYVWPIEGYGKKTGGLRFEFRKI